MVHELIKQYNNYSSMKLFTSRFSTEQQETANVSERSEE